MAYTEVTIVGYNANPPPDDGTEVSLNEIAWAKHIEKIGNPLKTAIEQIDDNMKAFSDESPSGQSGTLMLFQQTTAPTGWTKNTSLNDRALRVVSGTVTTAGTVPFSTVFAKQATDGHALTTSELPTININSLMTDPGHLHNVTASNGIARVANNSVSSGESGGAASAGTVTALTNTTGISFASFGDNAPHTHPMDIRVQYVDVILASKD